MMEGRARRSVIFSALAATLLALPAAAQADVLYDQTDHATPPNATSTLPNFSPSDEFTSGTRDDLTADDFAIPAGELWTIDEVDVAGATNGTPAAEVNVFLYTDNGGKPGTVFFAQEDVVATGTPNYSVAITGAPTLGPGRYWLSVQRAEANDFAYWSWGTRTVQSGSPAQFQSEASSSNCAANAWASRRSCWPSADPDQTFKLSGAVAGRLGNSSAFSFGGSTQNPKNGTARLTVTVPNAGHLDLSGDGIKNQSMDATAAGTLTIPILPNGKLGKKLKESGKASVSVTVAFTPNGVPSNIQTTKVKLKRRRK